MVGILYIEEYKVKEREREVKIIKRNKVNGYNQRKGKGKGSKGQYP